MADLKDKCVITCALTGVLTNPIKYPVPVTPEEMAKEARRAVDAGATIVHCHFRSPRKGLGHWPTWDPEEVAAVVDAIRAEVPELIINMSTGTPGADISGPLACLKRCKPEMAALNAGSLNYLKLNDDGKWAWPPILFDNPIEKIQKYLTVMNEERVIPECECFDTGIVRSVGLYEKNGMMKQPVHISFVMGVASGMPADLDIFPILIRQLSPGTQWQTIIVGRSEIWGVHRRAAELGGNVRTGLEDTFYLPSGERASSNGPLVEALVKMVREAGREPANFAEARRIALHA
jgi:3-keto-5-aminohexanoate cleavage enzyme